MKAPAGLSAKAGPPGTTLGGLIRRTRRPIGCRPNTPAEDARRDTEDYAVYEYREDAVAAGAEHPGYVCWAQYLGAFDLWVLELRRKSWSSGRRVYLRTDGALR